MPFSRSNFDPAILGSLRSPWGPGTSLSVEPWPPSNRQPCPDFKVDLRWGDRTFAFAVEAKSRSTPATLERAADQATRFADTTGLLPMVIVPYLSEASLDRLVERGVSGLDLSGNGVAMAPGVLYLRRSGQPNRYPESQPLRYAYRGATSVVPRVFLCRREFESVSAIKTEIESRGGAIALSTVSKALARMTEDVIVQRSAGSIALVQPDALLDRLRESFERPPRLATTRLACDDLPELFTRVNAEALLPRLVLSGASSQERYTAGRRSDTPLAWCSDLAKARAIAGSLWRESERFADLEVAQAKDGTPLFDARRDASGIAYASPVQTYLELAAGDNRDQEAATEIRQSILKSIG
ncbi:MAG TPA: hypothetical protein PKC43_14475 [Phycisphaerales bacterium]|nr:hypothetical protein [Phycisphaerales bacterium]HMP38640.1 hypothetical protein [Phycisphaerales bacterium]